MAHAFSEEFRQKHATLLAFLDEVYPDSLLDWEQEIIRARLAGIRGLLTAIFERRRTTGERPSPRAGARGVDVATQANVTTATKATDTDDLGTPEERTETGGEDPEGLTESSECLRAAYFAYGSDRERCWNCGSPEHFIDTCPRPRERTFCFRCGRPGYTVKECPECREGWRAQGPYRQRQEPGQRAAPRRTGKRPGALKSPTRRPDGQG